MMTIVTFVSFKTRQWVKMQSLILSGYNCIVLEPGPTAGTIQTEEVVGDLAFEAGIYQSQLFLEAWWALRKPSWKARSRNLFIGGRCGSFLAVTAPFCEGREI